MAADALVSPAPFFALRTPLLPRDELVRWSEGLRGAARLDDPAALADALRADRQLLRARLREIVARPEVREALFIASPSLDESLPVWLEQPESERGRKVERTLVRYFARMTSRATPFGLFAGCSVGAVAAETRLVLAGRARYRRHTRLDCDYLSALAERLQRDPEVRRAATYRPNTSLYRAAGRLRYAEARLNDRARSYHLIGVEETDALEVALACARDGAHLDAIAAALRAAFGADEIAEDEARDFVAELVDAQLLVPDLEPQVTGAEPIHALGATLRAAPETASLAAPLERAAAELAALDRLPLGVAPARYRALAEGLAALPAPVELARLFQIDMTKPVEVATLGAAPIAELVRAAGVLYRIGRPPARDALARFRDAFAARYEAREVPLCEALDEEVGVGFDPSAAPGAEASPLLEGLAFPGGDAAADPPAGPHFALLLDKLAEALRSGAQEIVLDDGDVEKLAGAREGERAQLPDSLAAMAALAAPSEEALAQGEFRLFLHHLAGPSGANLLGRFCHGDEALLAHVRDHLRREEARRPDAIFAEIVHLPEGRIGNVILRPLLREHELVFLGRSGAPRERQITLDDLTVAVRDGRVVLRSRRLGREVIPRLTTAHNFASPRNLGVYRFLCALQLQGVQSLRFDWGALEAASFLPRVRTGRTVLAPARWRLGADVLRALRHDDPDRQFAAAQGLRARYGWPRWIALVDGDHVLPVDLENVLSVETFAQMIKERPHVVLTELFGADGLCVRGPEGRFMNEIVLPLVAASAPSTVPAPSPPAAAAPPPPPAAAAPSPPPAAAPPPPPAPAAGRRFPPGSEWLYAKLYSGTATADELLRRAVAPVVEAALGAGLADAWFFIRYADPDPHLRVRLHGAPERLTHEVLPRLQAAALDAVARGLCWRVQLDTYEREVERYGGDDGIALSERFFWADSEAALGIVQTLRGDAAADARWRLTLRGMDQLLDDAGFTLDDKHAILVRCRDGFGREFHARGLLERQLGDKFRRERLALEALLDRRNDAASPLAPGLALFARRSERLRAVAADWRAAAQAGRLTAPLADVVTSWLHMHANRLLRGAARAQELVLYDFLARLYLGQLARRRGRPATKPPA